MRGRQMYQLWKVVIKTPNEISPGEIVDKVCCAGKANAVLATVLAATGGTVLTICLSCGSKDLFDGLPTHEIGPLDSRLYKGARLAERTADYELAVLAGHPRQQSTSLQMPQNPATSCRMT